MEDFAPQETKPSSSVTPGRVLSPAPFSTVTALFSSITEPSNVGNPQRAPARTYLLQSTYVLTHVVAPSHQLMNRPQINPFITLFIPALARNFESHHDRVW